MAEKLRERTEAVLRRGRASPNQMWVLLGGWNWACLLNRGLLSILQNVYDLMSLPQQHRVARLSREQCFELEVCLDLFPLMYCDLRRPISLMPCASDACPRGGGVVYADLTGREHTPFLQNIDETRVEKG